ncbi:hypothetical protein MAPG_09210 [Magnaporthiopsis poae ATCC 64411]|uniref:CBM21 domain-containing protein n=1 Tax=Magnaporthiopsis poae (strain ATCC 64411 / 73-15) TaxID=644358 RepID=A0A0C4E9D0_MAGP6|nr:hypothetical protein MAPG_09210 [Magnaporthiopsis poae ATCC 64411]
MPYTPPSHRSPASSTTSSPEVSRRPSLATGGSRPSLPRSASYLTRHRRTPSAPTTLQNAVPKCQPTPEGTSEDLKSMVTSVSLRKSPPPVTDGLGIPNGAILSPPESSASSDDDDLPHVRGRQIDNLKELKDAISQIPQNRESSPSKGEAAVKVVVDSPKAGDVLHTSFSTSTLDALAGAARRISHQRSATESDIVIPKADENSISASDADSEEELMLRKPQMVRKKSGELVRPALRPPSRRRPSSMPGTPTFSKAVHFDSHLEHVRHFLQVDRPLAVSAGSSPNDNYGSDNEFPFPNSDSRPQPRSPPFEWEIIVTNFPLETPDRKAMPVRLERVWLTSDQKCLVGSVDVANLAFQKHVTCRFTFDYWKTTSEVVAEYSTEIRTHNSALSHDRFNFTIKLSEMANLESKTLYFCIRYNVNGQELWDNNGGTNFQVDFRKKMLPQNGKRGFQGASSRPLTTGGLPKSNRRGGHHAQEVSKPKAAPLGMAEFGQNGKIKFDQSIEDYLGEEESASIRLKGVKSTTSIPSDNLPSRLSTPSGQAFANRYDFGASLSTAIQAAKHSSPKGDDLYMKGNTRGMPAAASKPVLPPVNTDANPALPTRPGQVTKKPAPAMQSAAPFAGPHAATGSSLASASYEELVNKYCFFGSKQSSPQMNDGTIRSTGRFDGPDEENRTASSSNDSSLVGTPLHMAAPNRAHGALHHSLRGVNPYFHGIASSGFSSAPLPVLPPSQQPAPSQARSSSSTPANTGRSTSPATGMAGSFQPMTGTSPPNELQYHQHNYGRFPFAETHSATAIRG